MLKKSCENELPMDVNNYIKNCITSKQTGDVRIIKLKPNTYKNITKYKKVE